MKDLLRWISTARFIGKKSTFIMKIVVLMIAINHNAQKMNRSTGAAKFPEGNSGIMQGFQGCS